MFSLLGVVDVVFLQNPHRHNVERTQMGGGEVDLGRAAFVVSLQETRGAETPGVSWFQARKIELRAGRGEIVSNVFGVGKELRSHDGTDRVAALILCAGVTVPVTEITGQGIG